MTYFNGSTKARLLDYLNERTDNNPALFVSLVDYKNGGKRRMTKHGVEALLKGISENAQITGVFPHAFRTKFATDSLRHGMPVELIGNILGHQHISTTMIYAQVTNEDTNISYKKIFS